MNAGVRALEASAPRRLVRRVWFGFVGICAVFSVASAFLAVHSEFTSEGAFGEWLVLIGPNRARDTNTVFALGQGGLHIQWEGYVGPAPEGDPPELWPNGWKWIHGRSGPPSWWDLWFCFQCWHTHRPPVRPGDGSGMDFYHLFVVVPFWSLALITGVPPTVSFIRARRSRRRSREGCCLNCGYDLRGNPSRCPECGKLNPKLLPIIGESETGRQKRSAPMPSSSS